MPCHARMGSAAGDCCRGLMQIAIMPGWEAPVPCLGRSFSCRHAPHVPFAHSSSRLIVQQQAGLKAWWLLTQVVRSRCAAYTCSRPAPDVTVLSDDSSGCSVVVLSCPAAAVDPKQVIVAPALAAWTPHVQLHDASHAAQQHGMQSAAVLQSQQATTLPTMVLFSPPPPPPHTHMLLPHST
jgi:hypothetical protein